MALFQRELAPAASPAVSKPAILQIRLPDYDVL